MRHGCSIALFALLINTALSFAQTTTHTHCKPTDDPCACCDPCCPPCPCGPCECAWDPGRVWFSGEYLVWRFKDSPLPVPLVTTTSNPNAFPTAALGQPGTSVLIGNRDIDTSTRQGARLTGGLWLDAGHVCGVEGNYFFIASHTASQGAVSSGLPGTPILAVPFFDADTNTERSFVRALPGVTSGGVGLSLTSRMQGAELNGLVNLSAGGNLRVDMLGGFRFIELKEHLTFATASLGILPANPPTGNNGLVFDTRDRFNTHNYFYGGQLGARAEYRRGNWFVLATGKVALGDMFEIDARSGDYSTNVFNNPAGGTPRNTPGFGAFVQQSNFGSVHRHEFAVVPEIGVNVGYQLTQGLRLFVGYDFLYVSDALRPGKQIDRIINFSQTVDSMAAGNGFVPGTRPAPALVSSDFWVQGVNFGVELRY